MFTRILVPLDGSPRAERALPVAAAVARASGAHILLLRIVDPARDAGVYGIVPAPALESVMRNLRAAAEAHLAEHKRSDLLTGLVVEASVEVGDAADSILVNAEAAQADLIVMSSHGRTGLARWALGSVAEHVVRHAHAPVLLLRDAGQTLSSTSPDTEHVLRVLVPLDGSKQAEATLEPAATLIEALTHNQMAEIHLAMVLAPFAADPASMPDGLIIEGARGYLERTARSLRERHSNLPVAWSVVVELDIAAALIRIAEDGEDAEGAGKLGSYDLLAMATHGTSGIVRWAMGSVTDRVLHATKLPILVVRPTQAPKP